MSEALGKVEELLGIISVGSYYTGKDRSYVRSIYKVVKVCFPNQLNEEQKEMYRAVGTSKYRHKNRSNPQAAIVMKAISCDGDLFNPTIDEFVLTELKLTDEYRIATQEEIDESARVR